MSESTEEEREKRQREEPSGAICIPIHSYSSVALCALCSSVLRFREALIKSHMRDWSAFVPCLYDQSRCGRLARDSTCLDRHKSAPVPRKRRSFIGLRQLQRLPRCAPCQGTYLGCGATPCIHLHLTQRASRDLISASLVPARRKCLRHA